MGRDELAVGIEKTRVRDDMKIPDDAANDQNTAYICKGQEVELYYLLHGGVKDYF